MNEIMGELINEMKMKQIYVIGRSELENLRLILI